MKQGKLLEPKQNDTELDPTTRLQKETNTNYWRRTTYKLHRYNKKDYCKKDYSIVKFK